MCLCSFFRPWHQLRNSFNNGGGGLAALRVYLHVKMTRTRVSNQILRRTHALFYPSLSLKGKWSNWISMYESNTKRAARLFMQIPTGIYNSVRDWNVTWTCTVAETRERKYPFSVPLTDFLHCSFPLTENFLLDFTEPQEAECLFMEIWYACVSPAYFSFSSVFCLPGVLSRMYRLPTYSAFLKILLTLLFHRPLFCI